MKIFLCGFLASILTSQLFAEEKISAVPDAKQNVIASYRVTVKPGHESALRTELINHATATQKSDFHWHVGKVLSGPDGNTFQIVEGPFSWTEFGQRAQPTDADRKSFEQKIVPHLEKIDPTTFEILEVGMSSSSRALWASQVSVVRYWVKPGKGMAAAEILKAYRQANLKRGFEFIVWHSINSGESVYDLVYQYPTGWKELDLDRLGIKEAFEALSGPGEYGRQQAKVADTFQSITNEMIEYFPDDISK